MLEQFLNHIARFKLCDKSDTILLAVSGGIDSMTMLHLFRHAAFNIAVAHCNFQLRGKESDDDESFVLSICNDFNIPVHTKRFATELFAWEEGLSIQMAARDLRYAWFEELLNLNSYSRLATAHHFDDSMETILLGLTKGASADGLSGIPVKNGNVIRPLLFTTRAHVEDYAKNKNIPWREDQSNLTDDYQRNFIRHQIIPKLKELNPSLEHTWQTALEKIQGDLELLHHSFEKWKEKFVLDTTERVLIQKKAFDSYSAKASILWRYIKIYSFNFEQAREIILALNGQSGKRFLSSTHLLVVDRESIILTAHPQEWHSVSIEEEEKECFLGPWKLEVNTTSEISLRSDRMEAFLDADKVTFPLLWRKWRNGDSFWPLGMQHKKKLSDFLVDNKLSVVEKNDITVVESQGQIVYVVGWRVDDRFKITDKTKRILNLRLERC